MISWNEFTTADGKAVPAGAMSVALAPSGAINLALAPNAGATPDGSYYKVVYKLDDGSTSTEYWTIPATGPTTIAAVRASVVPRQVALQFGGKPVVQNPTATQTIAGSYDLVLGGRLLPESTGQQLGTTGTEWDANLRNLSVQTLNGTAAASKYPGTDMCDKIATSIASLPSTGGTVDATGFQGDQTCSSNPFSGASKPVKLLLGAVTITSTATWTLPANVIIEGVGGQYGALSGTVLKFTGAGPAIHINGVRGTGLRDIAIDLTGNGSATQALYLDSSTFGNYYNVTALTPSNTGTSTPAVEISGLPNGTGGVWNNFYGLNIVANDPANTDTGIKLDEGANENRFFGGAIERVAKPIQCSGTNAVGGITNNTFYSLSLESYQKTAVDLGPYCMKNTFVALRGENANRTVTSLSRSNNVVTMVTSDGTFSQDAVGAGCFVDSTPADMGGHITISAVLSPTTIQYTANGADGSGTANPSICGVIWSTDALAGYNQLLHPDDHDYGVETLTSDASPSSMKMYSTANNGNSRDGAVLSLPGDANKASIFIGAKGSQGLAGSVIVAPLSTVDPLTLKANVNHGLNITMTDGTALGKLRELSGTGQFLVESSGTGRALNLAGQNGINFREPTAYNTVGTVSNSGLATFNGGIKAGASGSTIWDSRELIQSVHGCGTTSSCGNTANGSYREIWGTISLSGGSATLSGISPAFSSSSSFGCICTDQTAASACKAAPATNSSVSFGGTGTHILFYRCIGN